MKYPKSIFSIYNGIRFGYELHEYDESILFTVRDVDGFEFEDILTNKQSGKLISHTKNLHTSLFDSVPNFIKDYPSAYNYVLEKDREQRWSSLIEIIGLCLPNDLNLNEVTTATWILERSRLMENEKSQLEFDVEPHYRLQEELKKKVVLENELPDRISYIAGADVAYNNKENKMVGAIVVLDADTLSIVDSAFHLMDITFPYVPGLFSFREVPPLIEAFNKLKVKPDVLVCDGQGIAHPKGIGMASHLGIELNIPTIGCAKKRLVGVFDKNALLQERGNFQNLIWNDAIVGVALRTQDDTNPMFVSIGHKIDLRSSIELVLKLCNSYRIPETTRQSDQLVNKLMKKSKDLNLFSDPD